MEYNSLKEKRVISIMNSILDEMDSVLTKIHDICEDTEADRLQPCKARKMYVPLNKRVLVLTLRAQKIFKKYSYTVELEESEDEFYRLSAMDVEFNHYLLK